MNTTAAPGGDTPISRSAAASPAMRPAGRIVADALATQGVDTVFGVPGESYLAVLDGLHRHRDRIRFVTCRHEGGAAFMADAYGKLTGRPGVLMVTRGPGATNASIGIHTAHQDSTPMVVFVGQVGGGFADREAFQEIDYRRMFGPLTKWVAQVDRVERIPEYVARAFQTATSGRQGPVVLALPEDMLAGEAAVADAARHAPLQAGPSTAQIERLRSMLAAASRPFLLLGGSGWTPRACDDLRHFAQANALPVGCAFRCQDLFDNGHPNYCGDVGIGLNPKLAARIREADLVLAIGPRLGEITTSGYTLFESPTPRQALVHVHPGIDELGRVHQAALMVNSGMPEFATALRSLQVDPAAWAGAVQSARADYEDWQRRPPAIAALEPALDPWAVVQALRKRLPADAIVTNGAGNFATWAHRFWRYGALAPHPSGQTRCQLAPTSGAMGMGVPAAVAAGILQPDRTVVCFAGDGDFLMTGQELATAVQHEAGILVLVFDNGMYGTIRMHQEREYPARQIGTSLANPDFARLCEAFGGFGARVERTAEFAPALEAALAFMRERRRPALLHLRIDPEAITPNLSLSAIREAALRTAGTAS
ncbi:thiamine pyrophosphate-binding protein [Quisquiliibacterium transsilvanicum]|uniref:Acetolactate synthase-1/2/3 large subunit n=1 Tax=Quisquiliibacterium transsilvanicum TaxID=1549638 RepID=A0A7W8MAS9_9BURK|nr:thiamine pyrophosphate-binding protein [Quisquiliibacterium transsilvanicum]MBB5273434.1 acetolactate synthase-1/2/3 large subunit [Quisquiliibacterium transsilvanicum]